MNQKMVDKLEEITKDMKGATAGMEEYLAIAKEMVSVSDKIEDIELVPHNPKDLATAKSVSRYINQPDETELEQPPVSEQEERKDSAKSVAAPTPQAQSASPDAMALLTTLRGWEGLHEKRDKDTLMGYFRQAGFEFDPVTDPWCGAGLRAALVLSGHQDPGAVCHKASNYQYYGTRCDRKMGAIWVGRAHAGVITENDRLLGCNQSDGVAEHPDKDYGTPICYVEPIV